MAKFFARLFLSLSLILFGTAALAQGQVMDLTAQNARVYRSLGGANLSLPSQASPVAIVAGFLRTQGHSAEAIQSLVETAQGQAPQGLIQVRLEQRVAGLTVYGTYVKATLNSRRELVHVIENLATPGAAGLSPASISARDALQAALNGIYPGVSANFAGSTPLESPSRWRMAH